MDVYETYFQCSQGHKVQALKSNMAYIGTVNDANVPSCRCSTEYFKTVEEAQTALENGYWTERKCMENEFCNNGEGCNVLEIGNTNTRLWRQMECLE